MKYFVRARFKQSGKPFVSSFDTLIARTLYVVAIEAYAVVESEWVESC